MSPFPWRVVYVCADPRVPVFGPAGSSVHVQSVLRALLRRGAEVELVATRAGSPRPRGLEAVRLHRLPSVLPRAPARHEQAAREANDALAAVLHSIGRFDLLYERRSLWSQAALEHAWYAGVPAILEVNAPLIDDEEARGVLVDGRAAEAVADRQAACASLLAVVSTTLAERVQEQHAMAAGRVRVVLNGVDPERFPAARRLPVRPGRPFTVGFIGTLASWHGLPTLVEAFEILREREPRARLLVVGDEPERRLLEADLVAAGLRAAATLAGTVRPDRVPRLLGTMDAAVAPYAGIAPFHFSPLALPESMAAGLPVVASRVGTSPPSSRIAAPGSSRPRATPSAWGRPWPSWRCGRCGGRASAPRRGAPCSSGTPGTGSSTGCWTRWARASTSGGHEAAARGRVDMKRFS